MCRFAVDEESTIAGKHEVVDNGKRWCKTRAKAMSVLSARLQAAEDERHRAAEQSTRRNLVGSGDRSERIRTYNYPQGRLSEHRINLTLYRLGEILEGDLDCVITPLVQEYQADQLASLAESN